MLSPVEDLQWPSDIHSVHAIEQRDQNLDRLHGAVRLFINCTHFDGVGFWVVSLGIEEVFEIGQLFEKLKE